ncbi:MAG: helix-turn-helix transcriptional regulator, partial [Oscillospiraceae bacterium]|nr:helix-turn-helix transcriptional regulator [Oscillospiraceae bacterium]
MPGSVCYTGRTKKGGARMNAEKTGALIREAREAKNLSQQQLAEQLHITRTTV